MSDNAIEIVPFDEVQVHAAAVAFDRYGKGNRRQPLRAEGRAEAEGGGPAGAAPPPRKEWPEAMRRELQACQTAKQQRLWAEKWAEAFSGARRG